MASNTIGSLFVELGIDSASFEKGVTKAQKEIKKMERAVNKAARPIANFGRSLSQLGKAMTVSIAAPMAAMGVSATKAAIQFREASAQVKTGLESMGGASGKTFEELEKTAKGLERLSNFTAEEVMKSVTANMLTFGNISGEAFDRAQQAALDLSERLDQDLKSSTIQIGKALNDPIKGITALSRVGIQFTDDQRDMIKAMTDAGNVAEAQGVILNELERQYAGSAKAAQDAAPGSELQDAWREFQRTLGEIIVKVLPPITEGLARIVDKFNNLSPEMQKTVAKTGLVVAALGPLLIIFGSLTTALAPLLAGLRILIGMKGLAGLSALLPALMSPLGIFLAAIIGAGGIVYALKKWTDATDVSKTAHKEFYELIGQSQAIRDREIADTKEGARQKLEEAKAIREKIKAKLEEAKADLQAQQAKLEGNPMSRRTGGVLGLGDESGVRNEKNLIQTVSDLNREYAAQTVNINQINRNLASLNETKTKAVTVSTQYVYQTKAEKDAATKNAKEQERAKKILEGVIERRKQELREMAQGHIDVVHGVESEIVANNELTEALKISQHEYDVTLAKLRILANDGFLGAAEDARVMAEALVASEDALQKQQDEVAKTEAKLKKAGKTGVTSFRAIENGFNSFLNALKSGDVVGIIQGIFGALSQLGGKTGDVFGTLGSILGSSGGSGLLKGFAGLFDKGGRISAGQWGIAGENGPEFIRGPATVMSTAKTAGVMSGVMQGGARSVTFAPVTHVNGFGDERLMNELARSQKTQERNFARLLSETEADRAAL